MSAELKDRCRHLIVELGLGDAENIGPVEPLTGGVASDIARVRLNERDICIKFALPKLKVVEDWQAPVHRNAAEYAWLQVATGLFPGSGVKLLGRSETQHGFAMEYIAGADVYLWKAALLAKEHDRGEARAVGDILGRIHAASTRSDFNSAPFHNRDDFRSLRIDPYLSFPAGRHPDLATELNALARELHDSDQVLVHGDVSPKNILFRAGAPILLDSECATMGDASFDPSFCLNHLILKAVHLPEPRLRLLTNVVDFWRGYATHVNWESPDTLETRICRLVPALMLARVDGKSPVEYLDRTEQAIIRELSRGLIRNPEDKLKDLTARVLSGIKESTV